MSEVSIARATAFSAPAKLNLDLRITGRRADGYHNLESIFCLINLCDTIHIAVREDGKIVLHYPVDGVPAEQDLTYRAAVALQKFTDTKLGADIGLEKRIPMGGGLGGGSSDAATVLLALNYLWQCRLKKADLMKIGLKLGADVPFFIFGQSAFAKGVGEQLTEMDVPQQWYVVVRPPVAVATAAIFSNPCLTRNSKPSIMPTFLSLQPFRNDMQAVVLEEYQEVSKAYDLLCKYGQPLMSGSGSCLFLSFSEESDARVVYSQISKEYQTYCVEGLVKHPLFDIC